MTLSTQERRRAPRIDNNIPLKICQGDGDLVTETRNLSKSGIYCRVNRYIEPMSKLKTHLLIPVRKNGKNLTRKITCSGIVVRIEQVEDIENQYHVAIFFNEITQKDSDVIEQYVNHYLETSGVT